ncbi:MAG: hypothetical protein C0391_04145 [Anaerolinea sp.]|nr:hypothetical protein [Anaerolinea sp.]
MKISMPKTALWLVLLAILLASCSPKAAVPTVVPTEVPATEVVLPTDAPAAPAVCKVSSSAIPAASAEELASVASVPPVSETDLVRGPADAAVTIIEYSDYQ